MSPYPEKVLGVVPEERLHYHDNYNCAMSVVDKIESLHHPIIGGETTFKVEIKNNT